MILITGATGFVGRHVVRAFASGGHQVRCLVHTPSRSQVVMGSGVETLQGDIMAPSSLTRALEGVDGVVHLAAVIREQGPLTFQRVNHQGTRDLIFAAKEARVERVVHVSAIGTSENPGIPYLQSRWLGEQEVVGSDLPYNILRFSVGFGEGDEFINVLAALVKSSPLVPVVGDGKSKFQPIAVEDAAKCVVKAYEDQDVLGKTLELGGPEQITYEGIIDLIGETLGKRVIKIHVPLSVMRPVAGVMDTLLPRPPVTPEMLKMLQVGNVAQPDSVERAFGFKPRPLKGNIDYIKRISFLDALKINLGLMPNHIRDH